jgi:wyosine [tRNA(Phe)-imidazoG37] synthetase (radical SAM superfamily)
VARTTLDVKDHRRELDANRYVYAVVSRRAHGVSVGVNLNTDKVCNFDCPYCQVDRRVPGGDPAIDLDRLDSEMRALLAEAGSGALWSRPPFSGVAEPLRRLADVAFSGDGEPTTPAAFPEAARLARRTIADAGLAIPLRLITNATMFDRPRVREALGQFDELWCKLDAGTPEYFALVDGTRFSFPKILANLTAVARERPIVIQSLFMRHAGEPPADAEIAAWAGRLREVLAAGGTIDHVQVYTVARAPSDPRCEPLDRERLDAIAEAAREVGVRAVAYS